MKQSPLTQQPKNPTPVLPPKGDKIGDKKSFLQSLSGKFYALLILFFAFIVLVSAFSWKSFLEVVNIQKVLATKNIPDLILAGNIVQQSERLIRSAPRLMTGFTQEALNQIKEDIKKDNQTLNQYLIEFEKSSLAKNSPAIRGLIQDMTTNLSSIQKSVDQQRLLLKQLKTLSDKINQLDFKLHKNLVIAVDDKTFNLALQSRDIKMDKTPSLKPIQLKDILQYKELLNLQSQAGIMVNLLREVVNLSDASLIQPVKERFLASIQSCEKSLKAFPKTYPNIRSLVLSLKHLSLGGKNSSKTTQGLFRLKQKILKIEKQQKLYLQKNKHIAGELSVMVKNIHSDILSGGKGSTELFKTSLKKNQSLLLIINILSLLGCVLVAVFLVAPLASRLTYLAQKMKSMSQGELEEKVSIKGQDELAEMAKALEQFRLYALDVQRLNLVEKLMDEVKQKNKTLETTVANLHKTQRQLALQEKLASLGQLTAGIAHEIKNPLNFINNFSSLSKDLLNDIQQELEALTAHTKKETQEFIKQTLKDLKLNMQKISQHGTRINDIITGMLQHSRHSTGKKETVDINRYLEIYSNLAFHSKRASNSSFQVTFKKSYDKNLPPINIVPQDMSRVILNLLTNACDAIEEKTLSKKSGQGNVFNPNLSNKQSPANNPDQQALSKEADQQALSKEADQQALSKESEQALADQQVKKQTHQQNSSYQGLIKLETKKQNQEIVIKIWDNALGIPKHLQDKIFNPFWTTKETGKGTGLGLSLSQDIVSKYGGQLTVKSQQGQWTEFCIRLPIKS